MNSMEKRVNNATMTIQVTDGRLDHTDGVAGSTQPCGKGDRISNGMGETESIGTVSLRLRLHDVCLGTMFDVR